MDGLECKEVAKKSTLTNKDKRIDSQFWTTEIVKNSSYKYSRIGDVILNSQYGISVDMNTEKKGYPIFRMNEIHNMLTDLDVEKYADISNTEYRLFELKNRDVLFNRTNSYEWVGRTGIFYKNNDVPFTYASYLVKFVTNDKIILPEYLTAFLNTKVGIRAIKARARQSVNQTNVNPEEVKEIEIPILSMNFQRKIEQMFIVANNYRLKSHEMYYDANKKLLEGIKITSNKQKLKYSEKKLTDSFLQSGRLDAEYYQSKFEEIELAIKNIKHTTLNKLCDVEPGEFISETLYGNEGVSYVRGTNITSQCIDIENAVKVNMGINVLKTIEKNDLAFAMIGSVGNVAINREEIAIVSNNLGAIKPYNKNYSYYLLVYLLSSVGQALFEKYQTRTAQPKIRKEDIGEFLVPILSEGEIGYISQKAKESFELKEESLKLLKSAVKAVEMAIEADEETALNWLENQKV